MRRLAYLVLGALIATLLVGAIISNLSDIDRCYDEGGIVVAPFLRGQDCVMPKPLSRW